MKKRLNIILAVTAALVLGAKLAPAAGSSLLGGTFNTIGVGTRPLGMGGAFAAVADDANAAYDDPAGMGFFDKDARYATFTHTSLFGVSGLSRDYVAYAQADVAGFGAFGLSWNRFSADLDPEMWTEDEITYAGAKAFGKGDSTNMSIGWNLKYMRVDSGLSEGLDSSGYGATVGGGTASGYGLGLSLMVKLRESLDVAVVLDNIYSSLNWATGTLEVLSPSGRAGFAYRLTPKTLFSAEARGQQTSQGFAATSWHLGAEQWLFDGKTLMWDTIRNIGLRGGFFDQLENGQSGQVTLGASAKADEWQVDYAYQFGLSGDSLGATHRFGVSVNF